MSESAEIILDPKGNGGRDGRHWITVQRACLRRLAPAEVTLVDGPEEASRVARQSAMRGYRKIVAVGADATAHGVVNGLMSLAESHRKQLKAGFLSLTRPNRWSRTLGLPRNLDDQLDVLCAGHTLPFDVGRVEAHSMDGTQGDPGSRITGYFINGAAVGFIGRIRREWRNPGADLLETLPRLAAALRAVHPARAPRVRLESMGLLLHEAPLSLALLMGGRFYPGFGEIAPKADPTDGRLELGWLSAASPTELALRMLEHWIRVPGHNPTGLAWQGVEQLRISIAGADSRTEPVELELDGQPFGRLPAVFTVMRHALPVMVSEVAIRLPKPGGIPIEKVRNGQLAGNLKSAAGL